jgi:hypothetical protein
MKHVFVLVLLLLSASLYAQEAPKTAPIVKPVDPPVAKAAITDKAHADIRDLQLAISNTVAQAQQVMAPYNNRIQQLQGEINILLDKAFKETGLDSEKFQLDPNTLAVVEKQKPPTRPNPTESKQPAKVPTQPAPKEPSKKP